MTTSHMTQTAGVPTPFVVPLVVVVDDAGGVYVADLALGAVQKFEVTLPAMAGATPVS